ncbi:MAG: glycosyltransferase family 39 protein [bacterium]|nr:glycosyltransferase family 39 protein [bacterium]
MSLLSYLNQRKSSILNSQKFSPVDLIVFTSYYFFSLLLFLSLTGLLSKGFIVPGALAGFLIFSGLFWKRIEWKKHYLYFFIFIPLLLAGILLIKGYFEGMGMNGFLPWVREMVLRGKMVDSFDAASVGVTSKSPLMPLFYAGAFSLFGFSHWVIAALPLFFASATVLLLCIWLSEKSLPAGRQGVPRGYIIFGALLLLANPLFLEVSMHPLQEPFLLFFFTAFFYYLEKFRRQKSGIYFLLLSLSAVLSFASKEPGVILFLPLGWLFVQNFKSRRLNRRFLFYLPLTIFPALLWLLRNYIVFDNPISPYLNGVFKGRYHDIISVVSQGFSSTSSIWSGNIFDSVVGVFNSLILSFFPLIALSFYGFFIKRKIQYIALFLLLFSIVLFVESDISGGLIRYLLPFLGVFAVYAVIGLRELKSRIFLSLIFFVNSWGLLSTELLSSKSQFFASFEEKLNVFRIASQFIYDYRLITASVLGLFFFFLISRRRESAKYLILLSAGIYLVKAEVFHLGSWLNIWLPILGFIFITLIWGLATKLKESLLLRLISGYIIVLLLFNGWGLTAAYSLTHGSFIFPNTKEAYEFRPEMADQIELIEGASKNFYILADNPSYFAWYRNFKMAILWSHSFYALTNLEYKDELSSQEVRDLFKIGKIKYVLKSGRYDPRSDSFYDKIKNNPDLFKLIFQKNGIYLWRVD